MDTITVGYEFGKAIVWFALGFGMGYIARGIRDKTSSTFNNEKVIALLVAFIWAISVIADIVNPNYDTPIALHGLMGGIVGFYYKKRIENEKL